MNNVNLYTKANEAQRNDARELLEEYGHKINWKIRGDRSLDLGCGDGGVTVDILRKYLPENYESLVGCDISESMVRFASENFSDRRTQFMKLDMLGDVPKHVMNSFNHVFSIYAINWVRDHNKVFENIYDLLVDGGDCLLVSTGYQPIYDTYRELIRNETWKELLGDVEQFISPYHDSKDPEKDIKKIMTQVGFKNIYVKCRKRTYIYENYESLMNAMIAILPKAIPLDLYDKFIKDFTDTFWRVNYKEEANENPVPALKNYESIVIYGSK